MKGVRSGPQALIAPLSAPVLVRFSAGWDAPLPERESACAESPGSDADRAKALPPARPRWSSSIRAEPLHAAHPSARHADLQAMAQEVPPQRAAPLRQPGRANRSLTTTSFALAALSP
jgi:hypothetical protein